MRQIIETFIANAWELVPNYDKTPRNLREAIRAERGSCAIHSTLIGRMALQEGIPAMRSILFDSFSRPSHFSSYLFMNREWVRVSTDRDPLTTHIDFDRRDIEPITTSWSKSSYGLLEPISEDTAGRVVAELMIPELEMPMHNRSLTADDYLRLARYSKFMNEPEYAKAT